MESNRTADRGSTLSQRQAASEELERLIREFRSAAMRTSTRLARLRAAGGDLANFADGGADLYLFNTKEVDLGGAVLMP